MGKLLTSLIVGLLVCFSSTTTSAQVTFTMGSQSATQGQQVCLPVTVSGFTNIIGVQFSINYNPAILQFASVGNFNLVGLAGANFGTPAGNPPTQAGVVTLSWIDPNVTGVTVANGTAIFQVCFNVIGNNTTTVSFTGTPTAIEVTNGNGSTVQFIPANGTVTLPGGGGGGGNLTLAMQDVNASQGQQICQDVTVTGFTNIVGAQFSINYNASILQFASVGAFNLTGLAAANFGTPTSNPPTQAGVITFSWVDPNVSGVTVPGGTAIFEVCFNVTGNTTTTVSFTGTPTAIEFTNNLDQVVPATTDNGTVTISGGGGGGGGLTIALQDVNGTQGQQICQDVTVTNFTNIVGAQFSINYNASILQFASVGAFNLTGLAGANFGTPTSNPPTQAGVITFSWVDPNVSGVTVPGGTAIFEVCFNVTGNTTTTVSFTGTPTAIEFTNNLDQVVPATTDNGTVTISGGGGGGGLTIALQDVNGTQGQQICQDVTVTNFTNIVGAQFSINYNAAILQFVSVGTFNLTGLAAANFGTPTSNPPTQAGVITFSWVDPNVSGVTVPGGTAIFEVCFNVTGNTTTTVSFTGTPTAIEFTNNLDQVVPATTDNGTVTIGGGGGGGGNNGSDPTFTGFGLVIADVENAQVGQQVCMDVHAYDFNNIVGMQFSMNYNPAELQFVSVGGFNLVGLTAGNFGTPTGNPPTQSGAITLSWVDPNVSGVNLTDGTIIYEVCFNVLDDVCAEVVFSGTPTAIEVTDGNGNVVPFQSDSGTVGAGTDCGGTTGGGGPNGTDPTFTGFGLVIADVENAQVGQQVCMDVVAYEFTNIVGMQFSINYNPAQLQFVSVGAFNLVGLTAGNFGTPTGNPPTQPGNITLSWVDPNVSGVTLPGGPAIFEICFNVLDDVCSDVVFSGTPTAIEVTDGNGNVIPFQSDSGTVAAGTDCFGSSGEPPVITANVTNVLCRNQSTGSISLTVTGAGPFTYQWSIPNAGNVAIVTNLAAGAYSVTVTDSQGLTATGNYTITQPATALGVTVAQALDACAGQNNGTIVVNATGGTPTYSYSWIPPGQPNSAFLNNLPAFDFYRVTVTDAHGCTAISNFIDIDQLAPISIVGEVTNINCSQGTMTGSIALSITGGSGTYPSINWQTPLTDGQLMQTGLVPGTYSVTVTDNNNCTNNATFTVTQQGGVIQISNIVPANIQNGNDGSINLSVQGGAGTYAYSWTGPGNQTFNTQDLSNLNTPGQYCVTVTDNSGSCPAMQCVTLGENVRIFAFEIFESCSGGNTGSINISVSGGTAPYTYVWRNAANIVVSTNQDISGQSPGTYSVLITDSQGQQVTGSFDITGLAPIVIQGNVGSASSGNNGSILLTVSGGDPDYSYLWSTGAVTSSISGLTAGQYCVTVTDASTCQATQCFMVTSVPLGVTSVVPTGVSCAGEEDGSLVLVAGGGTAPYTLVIDGETLSSTTGTFNVSNLPAGIVPYTLTDAQGTPFASEVTIPEPAPFVVTPTIVHDSEDVGCTGSITLNISGGSAPYTVNWNTQAIGQQIINLCEGNFVPQITDDNGCVLTLTEGISLNTFAESAAVNDALCAGDENGSIDLTVSGGEAPYSFTWRPQGSMTILSTEEDLQNVTPGTYVVTIIEASGNTLTRTYIVGTESDLAVTASASSNYNGFAVSCADATNGLLIANVSGAQGSVIYEWIRGGSLVGNSQQLNNAPAGEYELTVIDELNCEVVTTFIATAPPAIEVQANVLDASCPGVKDGSILAIPTGGASPTYNFVWNTNNIGPSIMFLNPGDYTVTVTDMNNCQGVATFTVSNPEPITVEVLTDPATDDCNGTARAVVTGGTGSYNYLWINVPTNATSPQIINLCPGDYFVQVTDSNGCQSIDGGTTMGTVADRRFPCLDERVVITPDGNGTNDEFIIFCINDLPQNHLEIYNRWGQLVFETDNYDNTWEGTDQNGNALPEGPYYYVLEYLAPNGSLIQQKGSITLLRE